MPDFPVIDSHVHLYDPNQLSFSWMRAQPKLNRRHDISDFDQARAQVEVEGLVFVEVDVDRWGLHLDEAAWVQALADTDSRVKGICAAAPLEKGDLVATDLEKLATYRSVKGVRRLIQDETEAGFCLQPDFVAGVKQLAHFGLSFDLGIKHWQLKDAIALIKQCPEVNVVLNHIGKPGIKDGLLEPWKSDLKTIATLPNVCCKLSGVVTEADHQHWNRSQLRPYIEHVIECFGFDRLMYGSDWPVATLTHEYPQWVDIIDEIIAGCSGQEQKQLYRETAIRFYRLE